jgi:CubicO group peptidase (beta-lactamase class C family)
VLALVEEGKLELDAPVDRYLTRWQLPESEHDVSGVTVRRLLSHTAGLTDGLGYGGFAPGVPLQSLEDSLTRAADADPPSDGRTRVGIEPGTTWRYSGGGYTLLQLLIEETSRERFADYMSRVVFAPLGMTRSTFTVDAETTANVATIFDEQGQVLPHYRFTSQAAAGLYTNLDDLTRFVRAHVPSETGAPAGRGVLGPETLRRMRAPEGFQFGVAIWGLGTILYVPNASGDFLIGHDGNNSPATNAAVRVDPDTGDAFIALATGNRLLATELASEWVIWKFGALDVLAFVTATPTMVGAVIAGWLAIALAAFLIHRRRRQPMRSRS